MLLMNVIFWVGLLPMVLSCDADDCRVGVAAGAGYCGTAAAVGGAIACAGTLGLGCVFAAAAGGVCATAGAVGDAACGKCESDSYPNYRKNFKRLYKKLEDIKTNQKSQKLWFQHLSVNDRKQLLNQQILKDGQNHIIGNQQILSQNQQILSQGQSQIITNQLGQFEALQKLERGQEIIVEFQLKNLDWFRQLNSNDQNIIKNQATLITLQENTIDRVNEVLSATDKISNQLDTLQILELYGETLLNMDNIKRFFARLNRGKGHLFLNDRRAFFFRDFVLDPREGAESNINNIFTMLQGGGPLNTPSIYEKLGSKYCKPESHRYFLELQYESLMLYSIASAMDGHSVSPQVIKSFKQDLIRSTSAYIKNCGCPDNFKKSRRGEVGKLMQNLPESTESVFTNIIKVAYIENKYTRIKLSHILELKNIDVNPDSIKIVEDHPWEDIEILVQFTKNDKSEELELHNFAEICIDKEKNDVFVLWTGPSPSQTLELPDLNPSYYQVADPSMDGDKSVYQEVKGNVYGCNHKVCKQYIPEANAWTTIPKMKFVSERQYAAGALVGDKWVVQGGQDDDRTFNILTAEVWTPGTEKWVVAREFKSPLPVDVHCLVTINSKLMQIGGWSHASGGATSKCFLGLEEVASLKAPRQYHACTLFQGLVWVAGGVRNGGHHDVVEIYDPNTNTWTEGPKRPITTHDREPQFMEYSKQLYYIGGSGIGKIYRLRQNKDGWQEVADIERGKKYAALVVKKTS